MRVSQVAAGGCVAGLALAVGMVQGFKGAAGPTDALFSPFDLSYPGPHHSPVSKFPYYEKALPKVPSVRPPAKSKATGLRQTAKAVGSEAPPVPPKDRPTVAVSPSEPDSDAWILSDDTVVGDDESVRSLALTDTDAETRSLAGDSIRSHSEEERNHASAPAKPESKSESSTWSSSFKTLRNKLSLGNLKGAATNALEYLGLPGTKEGLWTLAFGDRARATTHPVQPTPQSTAAHAPMAEAKYNVDYIYVFGDSLSDTGNLFKELQGVYPPPEYYTDHKGTVGRFTNGKAWPDHLQDALHPNVQVVSYAHGGATTGSNGGSSHVMVDGQHCQSVDVNTQVSEFLAQFDPQQGPRTAAILWAGSNDVMHKSKSDKGRDPRKLGHTLTETLANLETIIRRLDEAGVKHIIVFNLPNVSQTPALTQRLVTKKQKIQDRFARQKTQTKTQVSGAASDADIEDNLDASFNSDDEYAWPEEVASHSPSFQKLNRRQPLPRFNRLFGGSNLQNSNQDTAPLLYYQAFNEGDEAYDADDEAEAKPKGSLKSRTKKLLTKTKPKLDNSVTKVKSALTDTVNKVAAGAAGKLMDVTYQGIKWMVEREINVFNRALVQRINSYNQRYPRDAPIQVYDVNGLFNWLLSTDMDATTPCLETSDTGSIIGVCDNPDNRVFFDQVHMTEAAHKQLAANVQTAMEQWNAL
ncbi:hypothetical protein H4R34_003840 [Dimargaris verticillata]|uniref:SGNH hydrolase-type esterase domain-containing protein n=1 Tax=Dimargaris verticillata TaxID=2761393 RepID=A0A9W8B1D9_9FUNG|nr:hypothetical protein H4R34_003840 [Dimargaris verticillata]